MKNVILNVIPYDRITGVVFGRSVMEFFGDSLGYAGVVTHDASDSSRSLNVTESDLPKLFETPQDFSNFLSSFKLYCFDETKCKFLLKPWLKISCPAYSEFTGDGNLKLPLGKPVTLVVEYGDPNLMRFDQRYNVVKFKDRYDFVVVDKTELAVGLNKTDTVTVFSNFPGVAKFRAKDDLYLCEYQPLLARFVQT